MVIDSAGSLYGTTLFGGPGGAFGNGTVFKLTPSATAPWPETVLYDLTGGGDGGFPFSGLISDSSGALYGTTNGGGASGTGTVFKLTPNGGGGYTESVLYSFAGGTDGFQPQAPLIADTSGALYGTTTQGGASGRGTVFKLTPSKTTPWPETVLYSFTGGNGGG